VKKTFLFAVPFLSILFFMPILSFGQDDSQKANLLVDDDKVQCPTAGYTTIQAAVNAARPGDLIRVSPGIYAEQVVINKQVHIETDNGVIVLPNEVSPNAMDVFSGDPLAAVILVQNAEGVDVKGLIVDGTNNDLIQCAPDFVGILRTYRTQRHSTL
jgi:hypothetical protein